jgi:hypothetical protein
MFVENTTSSVQRIMAVVSVLALGACADDTGAADGAVAVTGRIRDPRGTIREVTGSVDRSVLEQVPADAAADLAGCVQIHFCSTFVDNDSMCSSRAGSGGCNGDARAVCGHNRPIELDPAIPCPIAGVPTSFCGRGESLVWIHFW